MKRAKIRNAYTKAVGKDWYKKMLSAKQAKADKLKRMKTDPLDLTQPAKPIVPDSPPDVGARIEVTKPTPASRMEENTSPSRAIEKALSRIREQTNGL